MDGLLVVERMVLECLSGGEKGSDDIARETGLSKVLLGNILPMFLMRNVLVYKRGRYSLNRSNVNEIMAKYNNDVCIKEEVKELFISLVNRYFDRELDSVKLRMKKVWLNPMEKKILQAHLNNLDEFITGVERDSRSPGRNK